MWMLLSVEPRLEIMITRVHFINTPSEISMRNNERVRRHKRYCRYLHGHKLHGQFQLLRCRWCEPTSSSPNHIVRCLLRYRNHYQDLVVSEPCYIPPIKLKYDKILESLFYLSNSFKLKRYDHLTYYKDIRIHYGMSVGLASFSASFAAQSPSFSRRH